MCIRDREVFLRAWRQLHALRDPLAFGGWLRQIALHQSADHLRRGSYMEQLDPDTSVPTAASPNDEEAWFVLAEVRRLPEAYRAVSYTHLDVYKRQPW